MAALGTGGSIFIDLGATVNASDQFRGIIVPGFLGVLIDIQIVGPV
jgi:hypothetical protein